MHDNTSEMDVLVMQALEQRGHIDQLITRSRMTGAQSNMRKRGQRQKTGNPLCWV